MRNSLLAFAVVLVACTADTFSGDGGTGDAAADSPGVLDGGGADGCIATPMQCSPNAICANFDQGSEAPFQDNSQAPGSTKLTQDQFVSCTSSLESDLGIVPSNTAHGTATADLTNLNVLAPQATLTLSVWLPSNANGPFSALAVHAGDSNVQVLSVAGGWALHVGASNRDQPIQPLTGAWNTMKLEVVFSHDNAIGKAILTYEDTTQHTTQAEIDDTTYSDSSNLVTDLGVTLGLSGAPSVALTAYYDDVHFQAP
jgi:hypothetical protein